MDHKIIPLKKFCENCTTYFDRLMCNHASNECDFSTELNGCTICNCGMTEQKHSMIFHELYLKEFEINNENNIKIPVVFCIFCTLSSKSLFTGHLSYKCNYKLYREFDEKYPNRVLYSCNTCGGYHGGGYNNFCPYRCHCDQTKVHHSVDIHKRYLTGFKSRANRTSK